MSLLFVLIILSVVLLNFLADLSAVLRVRFLSYVLGRVLLVYFPIVTIGFIAAASVVILRNLRASKSDQAKIQQG